MSVVEPEKPERRGSQRETIKCGTCSRTYKSTTKIISCGRCEQIFCSSCIDLTPEKIITLKDTSLGALWFCANCQKDVMKLVHVDMDLEKLCKSRLDKMEKKLADLNHKLDEKADKKSLEEAELRLQQVEDNKADKAMVDSLRKEMLDMKTTIHQGSEQKIQTIVDKEIDDMKEIEKRKPNIMLFGVKESSQSGDRDSDSDADEDLAEVKRFITMDLGMKVCNIVKCHRVGKKKGTEHTADQTEAAAAPVRRQRALKVRFSSQKEKTMVMSAFWDKKNNGAQLKYGMANDYTRCQTEKYQRLKRELKTREEKGERDLKIQGLRIVKKR